MSNVVGTVNLLKLPELNLDGDLGKLSGHLDSGRIIVRGLEGKDEQLSVLSESHIRFPVTYHDIAESHTKFARACAMWEQAGVPNSSITERLFDTERRACEFCTVTPPTPLSETRANAVVASMSNSERQECIRTVVRELRSKGYMQTLDARGIGDAIENNMDKVLYGSAVVWAPPSSLAGKVFGALVKNSKGFYIPAIDLTVILAEKPTNKRILENFVVSGSLPNQIATLNHELTHDMQTSMFSRALQFAVSVAVISACQTFLKGSAGTVVALKILSFKPFKMMKGETLIKEADAFNSGLEEPFSSEPLLDEGDEIMKHIKEGYKIPAQLHEAVPIAYGYVSNLRRLGVPDSEISKQLRTDHYNPKTKTYPQLERLMNKTRENLGLQDDTKFDLALQALGAMGELDNRLARATAHRITNEALKPYAGQLDVE